MNKFLVRFAYIWTLCCVLLAITSSAKPADSSVKPSVVIPEEAVVDIPETVEKNEEVALRPTMVYPDVPLDEGLQNYIFEICDEREIDPAIVIAMIKKESEYDPTKIGDGGASYGLMQVQPRWHQDRMDILGVTDLLNPYENVTVGIDYFDELLDRNRGVEWALMAYNGGPHRGNNPTENVINYARTVLKYAENLEKIEVLG